MGLQKSLSTKNPILKIRGNRKKFLKSLENGSVNAILSKLQTQKNHSIKSGFSKEFIYP
jgi:hypothetical protein